MKHTSTALRSGAWSCALNSEQLAGRCRVVSSWLWEVFLHAEIPHRSWLPAQHSNSEHSQPQLVAISKAAQAQRCSRQC